MPVNVPAQLLPPTPDEAGQYALICEVDGEGERNLLWQRIGPVPPRNNESETAS